MEVEFKGEKYWTCGHVTLVIYRPLQRVGLLRIHLGPRSLGVIRAPGEWSSAAALAGIQSAREQALRHQIDADTQAAIHAVCDAAVEHYR